MRWWAVVVRNSYPTGTRMVPLAYGPFHSGLTAIDELRARYFEIMEEAQAENFVVVELYATDTCPHPVEVVLDAH